MRRIDVSKLVELAARLERVANTGEDDATFMLATISPEAARSLLGTINRDFEPKCAAVGLSSALKYLKRMQAVLARNPTFFELNTMFSEFRARIEDDLDNGVFLQMTPAEAELYKTRQLFGPDVERRMPRTADDIEEAGKCLAASRYTASVFHLMRVMEIGVQELGIALGVPLAEEKVWQVILDQVNKAVKALPFSTPEEKQRQSDCAGAAGHLFNVRVAWRNEVMHPKASYSPEDAEDVFNHVKAFMRHLATII